MKSKLMTIRCNAIRLLGLAFAVGSTTACNSGTSTSAASSTPTPQPNDPPAPTTIVRHDIAAALNSTTKTDAVFGMLKVAVDVTKSDGGDITIVKGERDSKTIFLEAMNLPAQSFEYIPADSTNEPLLAVWQYSGGAHCCYAIWVTQTHAGPVRNLAASHDFADGRPTVRRLKPGGAYVFVTANYSSAYKFGGYADSRYPIQIWQFNKGELVDVTREYPAIVLADAASHDKEWKEEHSEYALASELADLLTLGRTSSAQDLLSQAPEADVADLRSWLVAQGYGDPSAAGVQQTGHIVDQLPGYASQAPAAPTHVPPPAYVAPQSDTCENVDAIGVYDDGAILELSDGRHLHVDGADIVTSSVWVPPFDALICDDGDKLINKDDNESVDLQSP